MSQVGHDFPNSPCSGEFTSPSLLSSRTRSRCLRTAGSPCSGEFISPPSPGGSPGLFLEAPGFKPGVSVAKKGERRLQARGTNHQIKNFLLKFSSQDLCFPPSPPKRSTAFALLYPEPRREPRCSGRASARLASKASAPSPGAPAFLRVSSRPERPDFSFPRFVSAGRAVEGPWHNLKRTSITGTKL